eukprot:387875_1
MYSLLKLTVLNLVYLMSLIFLLAFSICTYVLEAAKPTPQFPNVTYATRDGIPLMLDIYWPNISVIPDYVTTMVYIHGGGWENGSKSKVPSWIFTVIEPHNYILVSLDYRRTTQAGQYNDAYVTFPAQIDDVSDAIAFLKQKENYQRFHIDTNNMGCWGDSAGSHLCILLGTSGAEHPNTNLTWSIGYYTPTDILYMEVDCNNTGVGCDFNHDWPGSPETNLIGWSHGIGDLRNNQNNTNQPYEYYVHLSNRANPLTFATKKNVDILPAYFLAHGTADTTVPYLQSIRLVNQLKEINHTNYVWYPCNCSEGCQHAHNPDSCWQPVDKALTKWLDQFDK